MGSWFWGTDALITNEKVIGRKVTGDRFKRQCPGKCFQLDADHGADHSSSDCFPGDGNNDPPPIQKLHAIPRTMARRTIRKAVYAHLPLSGAPCAPLHFASAPAGTSRFSFRTISASATRNASHPLSSPNPAFSRNAHAPSCCRRTAFFCDNPVNTTTAIPA